MSDDARLADLFEPFRLAETANDPVTGFAGRRRLNDDLEVALAPESPPAILAVFELGLPQPIDRGAGDTLIAALASALAAAVGPRGTCYRLRGYELCALLRTADASAEELLQAAAAALDEEAARYGVAIAFGAAFLPDETSDAVGALELADQRLYVQQNGSRRDAAAFRAS